MGNQGSKSGLKGAITILKLSAKPIEFNDEQFWDNFWLEENFNATTDISTQEIRTIRDGSPGNFARLTYKMVEKLCLATRSLCNSQGQQLAVLNATKILTRLIPCIFEDPLWTDFFIDNKLAESRKSTSDGAIGDDDNNNNSLYAITLRYPEKKETSQIDYLCYLPSNIQCKTLAQAPRAEVEAKSNQISSSKDLPPNCLLRSLLMSISDLLFCPEFTVPAHSQNHLYKVVDAPPEDIRSLESCDYVWEPGVGFDSDVNSTTCYDKSRAEFLRLLLACFSTSLYFKSDTTTNLRNHWVETFASNENRHVLPIFTSLLNTVFRFKPTRVLPFNQLLFEDNREELVELSILVLLIVLDHQDESSDNSSHDKKLPQPTSKCNNLFTDYMSRIHRKEDLDFIVEGMSRLLNDKIEQAYLIGSKRRIKFDQELLILLWRMCNLNAKIMKHLLNTREISEIVVPILYHLNENFQAPNKTALIHVGVFNLLVLSGERNFGVRLNKPYQSPIVPDLPAFAGSHADLLIIVIHKLVLYGQNLDQLFDFMLTIVVNVSPYLKGLSMLASKCLIHLFETFSSPYVVFTEPKYHQLVGFLLEIFNNIVQYQFDGNANMVYAIYWRKEVFIQLSNLPTSHTGIQKIINKLIKRRDRIISIMQQQQQQDIGMQEHQVAKIGTDSHNKRVDLSGDHTRQQQPIDLELVNQCARGLEGFHLRDPNCLGATISTEDEDFITLNSSTGGQPCQLKQEIYLSATPAISTVIQSTQLIERPKTGPVVTDEPKSSYVLSASPNSDLEKQRELDSAAMIELAPEKELAEIAVAPVEIPGSQNHPAADMIDSATLTHDDWKPTPDWAAQWKQSLPLSTTIRMIKVLEPQLERFCSDEQSARGCAPSESDTVKFLQNGTLVGLMPVPHPIVIRKYRTNSESQLWFKACTWAIAYVRIRLWVDTHIQLIKIVT